MFYSQLFQDHIHIVGSYWTWTELFIDSDDHQITVSMQDLSWNEITVKLFVF